LLLESVFAPLPHSPQLTAWACNKAGVDTRFTFEHLDWATEWKPHQVIGRHTIWTPPPEIAAQLIYDLLTCYVADPLNTSLLVILPRVLQKRWGRSSRHVREVGAFPREEVPLDHSALLQIPVVLLHVAPHVRSHPDLRLDRPSPTDAHRWHRQQATHMRSLPPVHLLPVETALL
jgi:hypothetical protein